MRPTKRNSLQLLKRPSLVPQRSIQRKGSLIQSGPSSSTQQSKEVPWDMLDRCLLPLIFCHASSVILGTILNVLRISQVSSFTLFIWFVIITMSAVLFYHNLQVRIAWKKVFKVSQI